MRGERETEAGESFATEPMQGSSVVEYWALLHKKIVGIKAKSKSKIRIKPNLESNLNRVA